MPQDKLKDQGRKNVYHAQLMKNSERFSGWGDSRRRRHLLLVNDGTKKREFCIISARRHEVRVEKQAESRQTTSLKISYQQGPSKKRGSI